MDPKVQACPVMHDGQPVSPQWVAQVGAGATQTSFVQTSLWQSVGWVHLAPSPQGLPVLPPQSDPASWETKPASFFAASLFAPDE
jgi:hypothetical protein